MLPGKRIGLPVIMPVSLAKATRTGEGHAADQDREHDGHRDVGATQDGDVVLAGSAAAHGRT